MASTPTDVAGILTMMLGASEAKCSAWSARSFADRRRRGSVCIDSRPLRPPCSSKVGSSSEAAWRETSSTTFQPISDSVAVGIRSASSAMRPCQRSWSARIAARAITGLHVAPTAPQPIAVASSRGSALSFQSAVGVVCVIVSSGDRASATASAAPAMRGLPRQLT